jgi:hypothetical protein
MYRFGVAALVCLSMAIGACKKDDRKDQGGLPPADTWHAPDPAAASGALPGGGADPHAGMNMNNPHAGMDMGNPHAGMDMGNPHAGANMSGDGGVDVTQLGLQPPDPDRPINPDRFLKGTIKPSAETKARIPPGAVIFLSVKRAEPTTGQPTGAPLAVKRLQVSTWPLWFEITEADAMISGTALDGDVVITAWSDQDQDAIGKQPGDVQGQARAKIPAKDLSLVLDKVIQ